MCSTPENCLQLIRTAIAGSKYENKLFIVGGYVRDKLLGLKVSNDVDIVLEYSALECVDFLFERGILDRRPITYPRFGTAMVSVLGHEVEFVTARRESYVEDTRKPMVEIGATLHDDAKRRDFTINTLLENLSSGQIIDPLGCACADLRGLVLRTPVDASKTFSDDPLRMLRAVRFSAKLNLRLSAEVLNAIQVNLKRLRIVSAERVRDEIFKIIMLADPEPGLRMLLETGLLTELVPEIAAMSGVNQNSFHDRDVWNHTLAVLAHIPASFGLNLRLAALFHDVGKPAARTVDNTTVHFYKHEHVGETLCRTALTRLRVPTTIIDDVSLLVRNHMRIGAYSPIWTDGAVRRLVAELGPSLESLFELYFADVSGLAPQFRSPEIGESLQARIAADTDSHPISIFVSPLSGDQLIDLLGVPASPLIGRIKHYLQDEVIDGRLSPGDTEGAKILAIAFKEREIPRW